MPAPTPADLAIWTIAVLATLGVLIRPRGWSEAIWAVAAALLLPALSLLPWADVWRAVARGTNVYLFLFGMMLLAELARSEGLFDWLAALAALRARGSPRRLFALVYAVGTVVTMLLSNDATAVVLTPAVGAVVRTARAAPLPYLFVCAFIANAASFTLPISNPANLVVFGDHLPPLLQWLARFALPSVVAIVVTFIALRLTQRRALGGAIAREVPVPPLSAGARLAGVGIALTAAALLGASAADVPLGAPTALAAVLTVGVALARERRAPWRVLRGVAWSVLPLVAGLFVLVAAVDRTGLLTELGGALQSAAHTRHGAIWEVGIATALACNLTNNLPLALVAGTTLTASPLPTALGSAVLVGVDLGPNLSVTGSLATILWLIALRREGEQVSAGRFLRLGVCVMLPALLLALAAIRLQHPHG